MSRPVLAATVLAIHILAATISYAAEPVDRELIPEARAVLKYLESTYGKKSLTGVSGGGNAAFILEATGREPAIITFDLCGWNSPTWGKTYTPVVERSIDSVIAWWNKGGIVNMQFHWKHPLRKDGTAWNGKPPGVERFNVAEAAKPGTKENVAMMEDLAKHADYLQKLADARVPVLWRPFHEIDGGWFWWTDGKQPENTAALWKMMFNYLVKERKLHNLIWVYSTGLKAAGAAKDATMDVEIAHRQRFYPGAEYVDIAGIDIYPNAYFGWGKPEDEAFPKALEIMQRVAPGKMLAMCESSVIVNPDAMAKTGPKWLYSLQWFEGDAAYDRKCYNHDFMITLDQLPVIVPRKVPPNVRITAPADGASPDGRTVELRAEATAHGENTVKVEFRRIPGPWQNWFLEKDEDRAAAVEKSEPIGEVTAAPFVFTWKNAPAGFHNVIARATDAKGGTAVSNTVRLSVGLKNLAAGKTATASSSNKNSPPARAADGDLFTAWSSEKSDPQWICVDLGSEQAVGAVSLLSTKANAKAFKVQLSADDDKWTDVYTETKGRPGPTVVSFAPARARYVRIYGTQRGTDWGGYSLYEFGVYESLPEPAAAK